MVGGAGSTLEEIYRVVHKRHVQKIAQLADLQREENKKSPEQREEEEEE